MNKYTILILTFLCCLVACTSQDDIYKEFVVDGGHIYPAKAINVVVVAGYQKVTVNWEKPKDPSVVNSRLFWNNKKDSVDVLYDTKGAASYTVTGLEDRSYTFYIVNFDANGNRSLDYEITANPYGANWLISHSERSVSGVHKGDSTVLSFSRATYELAYTRIAYENTSGTVVELSRRLLPDQDTLIIRDAKPGKKFYYKSAYVPSGGQEVVENTGWTKSENAILYAMNGSNWKVAATAGQVQGSFTPDKIFDGIMDLSSGRYVSSSAEAFRAVFPKILVIDTECEVGMEPTFLSMDFYQHPAGATYRYLRDIAIYIGDEPYDPNIGDDYFNTYGVSSISTRLSISHQVQTVQIPRHNTGRYIAIVFMNSNNTQSYFIDLWELVPFGYVEGDADIPYPDFE